MILHLRYHCVLYNICKLYVNNIHSVNSYVIGALINNSDMSTEPGTNDIVEVRIHAWIINIL